MKKQKMLEAAAVISGMVFWLVLAGIIILMVRGFLFRGRNPEPGAREPLLARILTSLPKGFAATCIMVFSAVCILLGLAVVGVI